MIEVIRFLNAWEALKLARLNRDDWLRWFAYPHTHGGDPDLVAHALWETSVKVMEARRELLAQAAACRFAIRKR